MDGRFAIEADAPTTSADGESHCLVKVRIPEDLRYLDGHFPGDPIVPGIAQLLPLVLEPARAAWPDLGAPTAIKRLKFLDALRPGHALEVGLTRQGDRVRFEIRRGDVVCTRGSLMFA